MRTVCAVKKAFDVLREEDIPRAAEEFCNTPRTADHDFSARIGDFFHKRGVNLRYLPQVAKWCEDHNHAAAADVLWQEVLVRSAKHSARERMRSAGSEREAVNQVLNLIDELKRKGDAWTHVIASTGVNDGVAAQLASDLSWISRLEAVIGLRRSGTERSSLEPQTKRVQAAGYVPPLRKLKARLQVTLKFRREVGLNEQTIPVVLQLIQLCAHSGDDASLDEGQTLVGELLRMVDAGICTGLVAYPAVGRFFLRAKDLDRSAEFFWRAVEMSNTRHTMCSLLRTLCTVYLVGFLRLSAISLHVWL